MIIKLGNLIPDMSMFRDEMLMLELDFQHLKARQGLQFYRKEVFSVVQMNYGDNSDIIKSEKSFLNNLGDKVEWMNALKEPELSATENISFIRADDVHKHIDKVWCVNIPLFIFWYTSQSSNYEFYVNHPDKDLHMSHRLKYGDIIAFPWFCYHGVDKMRNDEFPFDCIHSLARIKGVEFEKILYPDEQKGKVMGSLLKLKDSFPEAFMSRDFRVGRRSNPQQLYY